MIWIMIYLLIVKCRLDQNIKNLLKLVPPGDNYLYFTEKRGYPNPIFKWRFRYWSFFAKVLSPKKPS